MQHDHAGRDQCHSLAGVQRFCASVDPSEYQNCSLVMLFVKGISDAWHDHYEDLLAKCDGNEERARRMMRYEKSDLPDGPDFASLCAQPNADNLGEAINVDLEGIETAPKETLDGICRNIHYNSTAAPGRAGGGTRRCATS